MAGQFEKAEAMLLKSMSFEMHSPFCYYSLALVYMELKNFIRAINLWKIFLKIKVFNCFYLFLFFNFFFIFFIFFIFFFFLFFLFFFQKEGNVSGCFELAKCYFEVEDYIEAATCLNRAIESDSNNPDFFLLRAEAFELLNLDESAKTDYKRFKAISPEFELKYEGEIRRLESLGFFEEALKLRNFVKKIKIL